MSFSLLFSFIYIFIFSVGLCLVFCIPEQKKIIIQRKWQGVFVILFSLFTIAYAVFAFHVVPVEGNDLYYHYMAIDLMRQGKDAGQVYDLAKATTPVFLFRLLLKFVSLLPSNHFLQSITSIIIYSIFSYILLNYSFKNKIDVRLVSMAFLCHFSMCLITSTISGVRNVLVFAILSLALYIDFFIECGNKRQKFIRSVFLAILYVFPIFIHPSTVIVLVLRIVVFLFRRFPKLLPVLLAWQLVAWGGAHVLLALPTSLAQYIGLKVKLYLTTSNLLSDVRLWAVQIIFLLFILYIILKIRKIDMSIGFQQYYLFLLITVVFMFGGVNLYPIFNRMFILLSFIMLPILHRFYGTVSKNEKIICTGIFGFFLCGFILYNFVNIRGNMDFSWNMIL